MQSKDSEHNHTWDPFTWFQIKWRNVHRDFPPICSWNSTDRRGGWGRRRALVILVTEPCLWPTTMLDDKLKVRKEQKNQYSLKQKNQYSLSIRSNNTITKVCHATLKFHQQCSPRMNYNILSIYQIRHFMNQSDFWLCRTNSFRCRNGQKKK